MVQINISRSSKFEANRFKVVAANELITADQLSVTRNVTIHFLKKEKHDWAWNMLQNSGKEETDLVESIGISENLVVSTPCLTPISEEHTPMFGTDWPLANLHQNYQL